MRPWAWLRAPWDHTLTCDVHACSGRSRSTRRGRYGASRGWLGCRPPMQLPCSTRRCLRTQVDHAGLLELYLRVLSEGVVPSHLWAAIDMFEGYEWLVAAGVLGAGHARLAFDKHRYVGFSEKGMRGARDEGWLGRFACAALADGFDLRNASEVAAARGERMAPLLFGEWSVSGEPLSGLEPNDPAEQLAEPRALPLSCDRWRQWAGCQWAAAVSLDVGLHHVA
ncbi:hypothetical protein OAO87_03025, partial [bacterium]|nr:hypothetical protein [bacterium]